MATINIYEQYFEAKGNFHGVERHAVKVMLMSDSEAGHIRYEIALSFFPHRDEEDFCITYDAYFSRVVYDAIGRRSKKRETELMKHLRELANSMSSEALAFIDWDKPLGDAKWG